MMFNVNVWVNHDEYEYDPDSWITGPDDDFIPAEYNSVMYHFTEYRDVTWSDVMDICDTWAMTPGDHDVDITPAR